MRKGAARPMNQYQKPDGGEPRSGTQVIWGDTSLVMSQSLT
jgi:hypothetical protein